MGQLLSECVGVGSADQKGEEQTVRVLSLVMRNGKEKLSNPRGLGSRVGRVSLKASSPGFSTQVRRVAKAPVAPTIPRS